MQIKNTLIGAIALTALTFGIVACSSGDDPSGTAARDGGESVLAVVTGDATKSPSGATEESLLAQLEELNKALKAKDFTKLYTHTSPQYREACSLSDFLGVMVLASAFAGESFFEANHEVSNLVIDGSTATYTITKTLNGAVLSTEDVAVTFIDDKWVETGDTTDTSQCTGS